MKLQHIGIIYPSNGIYDSEFIKFAPNGTAVHLTRWAWPNDDWSGPRVPDRMAELANDPEIAACASLFDQIDPAVVTLGCTSVSFAAGAGGDIPVLQNIRRGTRAKPSSTSTGFAAACAGLGVERVAVASIYTDNVTSRFVDFLEHNNVRTVSRKSENWVREPDDDDRLTSEGVLALAAKCDHPLAQAILIPETNILTSDAIPLIEKTLGKPVLTAIQVTVWHAARMAGVDWAAGIGEVWKVGNIPTVKPD